MTTRYTLAVTRKAGTWKGGWSCGNLRRVIRDWGLEHKNSRRAANAAERISLHSDVDRVTVTRATETVYAVLRNGVPLP